MNVVSPRAAALRILAERAGTAHPLATRFSLTDFQSDAVGRAQEILRCRGGVIIADGVGMGKTFIAAALIDQQLHAGDAAVVVVPAALRGAWKRTLQPLVEPSTRLRILSHGQLSRSCPAEAASLVVVDEAHAFRNPDTKRYRALRRICRAARVVLITATPVNNSLSDLYFQLRLFAADDAFRDLGIGSLRLLLRAAELDHDALRRLRFAVIIRRTRESVRARFAELTMPDGSQLRFPQRIDLMNVHFSPAISTRRLTELLDRITFAVYADETTRTLVALSLLKRIQSSRAAALISVDRMIAFHHAFLSALKQGRFLKARGMPSHMADEQLYFSELLLDEVPAELSAASLKRYVDLDLQALQSFRSELLARPDEKLPRLLELLSARSPPARTLVFTEFRDTAEHIWQRLAASFQVGLITGGSSYLGRQPCPRGEVIRRFAPRANDSSAVRRAEEVFVLVATDVLAEGLNLQDANAVLSYELPWNPVRLIQRSGRIDRIGSQHAAVSFYNFMPDREFDELLGLVQRLRTKLRSLRSAVGHETPVLEADESALVRFDDLITPSAEPLPDFDGAAPLGSIASLSPAPRRVLACWQLGSTSRELIVDGEIVKENHAETNELIDRALRSDVITKAAIFEAAINRSHAYLKEAANHGVEDRVAAMLARSVQRAVQSLGLHATPDVIQDADALLPLLPGYLGRTASHLALLEAAQTSADVRAALTRIRLACTEKSDVAEGEWRLVAAIGSD